MLPQVQQYGEELGLITPNETVPRSKGKRPLLAGLWSLGERAASDRGVRADVIVWINADIVLPAHFTRLVTQVARDFPEYLLVGQRYSLDTGARLVNFENASETAALFGREDGKWDGPQAIDYFVFNRGAWRGSIPADLSLAWAWDQYLLSQASRLGLRTIDATRAVRAIHQSHSRIRDSDADSSERWRNLAVVGRAGGWKESGFTYCALYEALPCRGGQELADSVWDGGGGPHRDRCESTAVFPLRRRRFPEWARRSDVPPRE
jgi:hypothetical protein